MKQICPKCQSKNIADAKFCKRCGAVLIVTQANNTIFPQALNEIEKRILEEKLYEQVAIELKDGFKRDGAYARALADAEGSEEKAKGLYIKYAVQSLMDELSLQSLQEQEIRQKQAHEDELKRLQKEAIERERKDEKREHIESKNEDSYFRTMMPIFAGIVIVVIVFAIFGR